MRFIIKNLLLVKLSGIPAECIDCSYIAWKQLQHHAKFVFQLPHEQESFTDSNHQSHIQVQVGLLPVLLPPSRQAPCGQPDPNTMEGIISAFLV